MLAYLFETVARVLPTLSEARWRPVISPPVLLCYRPYDDSRTVEQIRTRLLKEFRKRTVFADNGSLSSHISRQRCTVLLVIVGRHWESSAGVAALKRSTDHIHVAIESALSRKSLLIPILVDDAEMPKKLPTTLKQFGRKNAAKISKNSNDFENKLIGLVTTVKKRLNERSEH